mgnify:CR=1 FL=1
MGTFASAEDAARVFDVAARHFQGDYAWTNFQDTDPDAEALFRRWLRGERIGLKPRRHPRAVLTDDDARDLRRRYAAGGVQIATLAEEYGVCFAAINHAIRGRTFKHVTDVPPLTEDGRKRGIAGRARKTGRVLTDAQVREARRRYATTGVTMRALAEEFGVEIVSTGGTAAALADAGVTACVEPGGSVKDAEVIAAADARGMALVFSGRRHFRH